MGAARKSLGAELFGETGGAAEFEDGFDGVAAFNDAFALAMEADCDIAPLPRHAGSSTDIGRGAAGRGPRRR